ncbi:hypothetical protein A3Q56_00690 [Intoshia linei]|uniref:Cytochrome P450 n=1 Tax=Intoshia linei TaxID=1819745 RepID=A0A177BCZ7_9BILA|nr:hypothetical protein A3Q56_00690 [Intoshia linei]
MTFPYKPNSSRHQFLLELSTRINSDIYKRRFGTKNFIIVNGCEAIDKLLSTRANFLSEKPDLGASTNFINYGAHRAKGVAWTFRKNILKNIFTFNPVVQHVIKEEMNNLFFEIEKSKYQSIRKLFEKVCTTISYRICFERHYTKKDRSFLIPIYSNIYNYSSNTGPLVNIADLIYICRFIPKFKRKLNNFENINRIIRLACIRQIELHLINPCTNNFSDGLDFLIDKRFNCKNFNKIFDDEENQIKFKQYYQYEKSRLNVKQYPLYYNLSNAECSLYSITEDMIRSGSEAPIAVFSWFCVYMAYKPNIQQKLYNEIVQNFIPPNADTTLLSNLYITENLAREIKYLKLVVIELLRCSSAGPMGKRNVTGSFEFTYQGKTHKFQNNDTVLLHYWSTMKDERHFRDPNDFNPERWSKCSSNYEKDMLPFGIGERKCPASHFMIDYISVLISNIIIRFKIKPKQPTSRIYFETIEGMTIIPKLDIFEFERI